MPTTKVRPWRLVILFSSVFLLTAYVPHPNLGASLPESVGNWLNHSSSQAIANPEP